MSKHDVLTESDVDSGGCNPGLWDIIENLARRRGVPLSDIRVLDWGSGRGVTVARLRKKGIQAYGVEIDPLPFNNGMEFLKSRGWDGYVHLIGEDFKAPFPDGEFDIVFTEAVMEHVSDAGAVIDEMCRITGPGGEHYHEFPAKYHPREGHLNMPFVHWLPKNRLRYLLIRLYVQAGIEPRWAGTENETPSQKARRYYDYSIRKTYYRSAGYLGKLYEIRGYSVEIKESRSFHRFLGLSFSMPSWCTMHCVNRGVSV